MNEWEKIRRQLLAEIITIDRIIDAVQTRPPVAIEMLQILKGKVNTATEYLKLKSEQEKR